MTLHSVERLGFHIREQIIQSHTLTSLPLGLAIFGSARTKADHRDYHDARELAAIAAEHGVPVISGGGPGIMMAANQGAYGANGVAVGLNIQLPHEQHSNQYQTHSLMYEHFAPRKMAFVAHSAAFVVYPGGFGTLDELFEVLTLVQTQKIGHRPVVLIDRAYWGGLVEWVQTRMLERGMISQGDESFLQLADDALEAWAMLKHHLLEQTVEHSNLVETPLASNTTVAIGAA